jgi:carboxyl-terminal processing protease
MTTLPCAARPAAAIFCWLALIGTLVLPARNHAADKPPSAASRVSPALQAYDELQALRNQHGPLIWGGKPASADDLRKVLSDLDTGLARIGTPLITDLSFGWMPLAARRIDFLIDKLRVLHRLNDRDGVARTWRELNGYAWVPPAMVSRGEASLQAILDSPELADLRPRAGAAAWLATPNASTLAPHPLSREERIAGLSTIWSMAREYFVWFDHAPALDWDRAYLQALPPVMDAPDEATYWRELMRFTALLRDGHSNAYPPESMASQFWSRPGLRTARVDSQVLVMEVRDPTLRGRVHIGDRVLTIDGEPVDAYAARAVTPYQSSSTAQDLEVRSFDYGLLAGAADRPVTLELQRADGTRVVVQAPRSGYPMVDGPASDRFELRPDGVAVITAGQFESDAALELLRQYAPDLLKAKALIVDLRGNGGGSSENGLGLLRWLTRSPLPSMRSQVRVNDPQVKTAPLVVWRPSGHNAPQAPIESVFEGPVALLIDARTFSAAEDTAAVFKLMKRGPIVGVPSGGSTGQPLVVPLPGGGMLRICAKRDSYPDGSDFVGEGVQPDVLAPQTVASIREGRDPAFEQALQQLLRQR